MRFWINTFALLIMYGSVAAALFVLVCLGLDKFFSFLFPTDNDARFLTISLAACCIVVAIISVGLIVFYLKRGYRIKRVRDYVGSIDLCQNILFFLFFPFLGILINQLDQAGSIVHVRQIIGGTLIILKISMLIFKYAVNTAKTEAQQAS